MSLSLFAADALTPDGWRSRRADRRRFGRADRRGAAGVAAERAERVGGPLIPGMPNLHSHAFPARDRGSHGRAGADGDSFWTWRAAMYAFLDRVDADAFAAIAAQAYVEMLKAGYTRVAEFHYCPSRSAEGRTPIRPSSRTRSSMRPRNGHRAHAAPGVLCARRLWRRAADSGQRRFVHSLASYRA
jgi:formimidoylglutamate deiminase